MNNNPREDLKEGTWDWAHTIAKAGLSAIPIAGGPVAELFAAVIVPPLSKRRDQWLQSLAEGLEELKGRVDGFTVESLAGNDIFITSFLQASQAAIRNHQKEKLDALRNALLNVAAGNAPDEDPQLMFLAFIDALTPWHLKVLQFFQTPEASLQLDEEDDYDAWRKGGTSALRDQKFIDTSEERNGILVEFVKAAFPQLCERHDFAAQIIQDLISRGLADRAPQPIVEDRELPQRTTTLGDLFISFITSPIPGIDS